ncbi:phage major capsid protein [Caproiciproducens sp.]
MTKEKYMNDRNSLLTEAEALINDGKLEDAAAKTKAVEDLDTQFDNEAKALANLNALKDNQKIVDLSGAGARVVDSIGAYSPETTDMYDSVEYRKAFMNNVLKGTAIPAKFQNADANTKTTDVGSVIPTTIMQKIIEKMESTGMILPLVTKTAYQGGLSIPTSSVKPVATWVSEGATSDKQKKTTGSITFTNFKLRCAISMSLETSVVTLGVFETAFTNNVAEAMVKAQEQAIISGDGTTQPKGILTETPVDGQTVTLAAADKLTYATLISAESALPLAYEANAVWCMTKKTFMQFVGMLDSQKQPIARVNQGINGRPERTLLGRTVVLNDYMGSYADTVTTDTLFAFLFSFSDYVLNTNYAVTVKRYEDNETDDQITKAIMLVDGKVVDKNSLVVLKKTVA